MDSLIRGNDERSIALQENYVFGLAPSETEVEGAMCDLQSFFDGNPGNSSRPELNELGKMLNNDSRITQSSGYRQVQDAYQLMKSEPLVRKMVASISSDKAVWDAVLRNAAVRELRESMSTVRQNESRQPRTNVKGPNLATLILSWILGTMPKIGDLLVNLGKLVNEFTKGEPISGATEGCEEKVKSSFLLSLLTFLIVVITRMLSVF